MGELRRTKDARQESRYVFMWTLTEAGSKDLARVKAGIRTSSAMVKALGGSCRLYVTTGGPYDLVGIARGLDDTQASQLRLAVDALGHVRTTTFFKLQDFTLDEFDRHVDGAVGLVKTKA
jgi:uncharacterized protein with GYD domain